MHHNGHISNGAEDPVREKMKRFWQVYEPTIESMMLSTDAQYLAENEQNELLSYLPQFRGMKILELGAGIGRFTSKFAQIASHVTAVDFMESYINENKETNKHFENIAFQCADAMKIDYAPESFGMVFSNWLLMYLTDSEVEKIMGKILRWLKPGGYFFFRESCYHQSGNILRKENPTLYRTPVQYLTILHRVSSDRSKFTLKTVKNVLTYIHYHGNPNQLCLLAQKHKDPLPHTQISENKPATDPAIEVLIPPLSDFPEGESMLKSLGGKLCLREGHRTLHVECGGGTLPLFFATHFNVFAHGVDRSPYKIHKAIEAQGKVELSCRKRLQYESTDWIHEPFYPFSYEAVLGLDLFFDKEQTIKLITKGKNCLKSGGKMAVLGFIREDNNHTPDTEDFLTEENLREHLSTAGLTLEEMKSESEIAIKYLTYISSHLKKSEEKENRKQAQIARKSQLLQGKSLHLFCIIARK